MELGLIIPAFIAGILTFLAPCTFPLVPGYLGFISGTSLGTMKDGATNGHVRAKMLKSGLFFVLGFSAVFIVLGSLAGFGGRFLIPYKVYLSRISGVLVMLLGATLLGLFKLPILNRTAQFHLDARMRRGSPRTAFAFGAAFGFGWTPCVGPILGSVLILASTTTTVLQGAVLLAVFSAGLALPFLAVAYAAGHASRAIQSFSRFLPWVERAGGALLLALGYLMLTDGLATWVAFMYRIFSFINYDRLLDYL